MFGLLARSIFAAFGMRTLLPRSKAPTLYLSTAAVGITVESASREGFVENLYVLTAVFSVTKAFLGQAPRPPASQSAQRTHAPRTSASDALD